MNVAAKEGLRLAGLKANAPAMTALALAIGLVPAVGGLVAAADGDRAKTDQAAGAQQEQRFDMQVREDFFAGFAGDAEALARGMKRCEEELAKDPKNAEALVWHGAGLRYSSKKEFIAGDFAKGREIQARGTQEMDEALALRPDDVAVLIPRASVFLAAALHVPSPEEAKKDFEVAARDYGKTLKLQESYFSGLPVHARGEIYGGMAEALNGLGNSAESRQYLEKMVRELPGTAYARKASDALTAPAKPGALGTTCLGCHVTGTNTSK